MTWIVVNVIAWGLLAFIILNSSFFDLEYAAWRDENQFSTLNAISRYFLIGLSMGFAQWIALHSKINYAFLWVLAREI